MFSLLELAGRQYFIYQNYMRPFYLLLCFLSFCCSISYMAMLNGKNKRLTKKTQRRPRACLWALYLSCYQSPIALGGRKGRPAKGHGTIAQAGPEKPVAEKGCELKLFQLQLRSQQAAQFKQRKENLLCGAGTVSGNPRAAIPQASGRSGTEHPKATEKPDGSLRLALSCRRF